MKKLILLFSLILLVTISCKQEFSERPSGIFIEKAPVPLRTIMNFTSETKVTITDEQGKSREYSYSVGEIMMTLTPLNVATYPAQNIFYHYTDANNFEIGSIYGGEGEIMVFEKSQPK